MLKFHGIYIDYLKHNNKVMIIFKNFNFTIMAIMKYSIVRNDLYK